MRLFLGPASQKEWNLAKGAWLPTKTASGQVRTKMPSAISFLMCSMR